MWSKANHEKGKLIKAELSNFFAEEVYGKHLKP